jgi:hypothetical protein
VTFESYVEGDGAAGTFTVTFDGGDTIEGSFDAIWCEPAEPLLCG